MKTKHYKVTVQHDKGKLALIVPASSVIAAKNIVKSYEHCPDSAILSAVFFKGKIKK